MYSLYTLAYICVHNVDETVFSSNITLARYKYIRLWRSWPSGALCRSLTGWRTSFENVMNILRSLHKFRNISTGNSYANTSDIGIRKRQLNMLRSHNLKYMYTLYLREFSERRGESSTKSVPWTNPVLYCMNPIHSCMIYISWWDKPFAYKNYSFNEEKTQKVSKIWKQLSKSLAFNILPYFLNSML